MPVVLVFLTLWLLALLLLLLLPAPVRLALLLLLHVLKRWLNPLLMLLHRKRRRDTQRHR